MKRFLFLLFATLFALTTWAYSVTDDSTGTTIYYNTVDDGLEVTYGGMMYGSTTSYCVDEVIIPEYVSGTPVVGIGADAFDYCTLKAVSLPSTLQYIRDSGFYECESLTEVEIPESVTVIEGSAFYHCYALEKVNIPSGVTSISEQTFYGCSKLTTIELPAGVTSIGNYAFRSCTGLTSITCLATTPPTCSNTAFQSVTTSGIILYVPSESVSAYQGASIWSGFNVQAIGGSSEGGSDDHEYSIDPAEGVQTSLQKFTLSTPDGVCADEYGSSEYSFTVYLYKDGASEPYASTSNIDSNFDTSVTWNGDCELYFTFDSEITEAGEYEFVIPANSFYWVIDDGYNMELNKELRFSYTIEKSEEGTPLEDGATFEYEGLNYKVVSSADLNVEVTGSGSTPSSYSGDIVIPESATYDNVTYHVVGIGDNAFYVGTSVTGLTIANSVEYIGAYAFYNCSQVKSIDVPSSVTSIGQYAFQMCSGVTSMSITGVDAIADGLFYSCSALESVELPTSVSSMGKEVFRGCSKLASVTLPDGVTTLGSYSFYSCSALTSIAIPSSVTTIDSYAFASSGIAGISFANGSELTSIGNYAFNASKLEAIKIPASVETIGSSAFYNCTALADVTFADGCALTTIDSYAFRSTAITSIEIPDLVETVNSGAFQGCSSLTEATIGESVTKLGDGVFYGCTSLMTVTALPATPPTTGSNVFDDDYTVAFGTLYVPCESKDAYSETSPWSGFLYIIGIDCVDETVKFEVDGIYYQTTSSSEVEVTYGGELWSSTSSYTGSISIPDEVTYSNVTYKVIGIGQAAFYECASLSSISLPNTIQYIDQYAFAYETSGESNSLTEIVIPESCTSIATYAFQYCTNLASVTLPSGITEIPTSAFDRNSLTSIEIPEGVTAIGANAFRACPLTDGVTCYAVEPPVCTVQTGISKQTPFTSVSTSSLTLYVPSGSEDAYGEAEVWEDFGTIEAIGGSSEGTPLEDGATFEYDGLNYKVVSSADLNVEVTGSGSTPSSYSGDIVIPESATYDNVTYHVVGIGDNAFYVGTSVTGLTIANSVEYIGAYAFYNCSQVKSIEVPSSVTSIGQYAFQMCSGVTSMSITGVDAIADGLFYSCSALESVELPESVSSMGKEVFRGCSKLASVTLPDGVTTLGSYSFYSCSALTSITIPASVTTIDTYAFQSSGLVNISFANGSELTSINDYAFNASKLESIKIPASVETIGNNVFYNCSALADVTFEEGSKLTSIGNYAFRSTAITSIEIPDNVETVNSGVFQGCSSLTEATIGESVTKLGDGVFYSCTSLMTVTALPTTPPSCGDSVFDSATTSNGILYVPCDSKDAYAEASTWSSFANIEGIDCEDEGGIPAGYILDPADESEVETLKTINISYDGAGLTCADAVYAGTTGVVMSKTGGQVATVSFEDGWDDDLNLAYVIATLSDEISEMGTYYVTFPEKVFMDWDDYGTNPEFTATYYVTGPTSTTEYTFDPEDGSTLGHLSEFTVGYADGINCSWNYTKDITVTNEAGDVVAKSYDCEDNWPDNWDDPCVSCTITLDATITAAGNYTVNIPEGYFVVGSNYLNSEALTIHYTVDGSEDVSYELVVDPESGSTVESLSEFTITCEDGLGLNLWDALEVKKDDVVVAEGWYDITVRDDDGNSLGYTFVLYEPNSENTVTLTDEGEYTIEVPDEYFVFDNESLSEGFTIVYTIEAPVSFSDYYTLDPEEGVVESLSHVKFTAVEGMRMAWAGYEYVDVDEVKVYKDGDTSNPVAYGASITAVENGNYDSSDDIIFNVTLSDPGEYDVVFPANFFVYYVNKRTYTEEFSLHYTIEESSWGVPSGYVLDPADESEVETLSTIKISLESGSLTLNSYDAQGVVMSKTGGQVATVSFTDDYDDELQVGYCIATLSEEISEMGTYYVTFPAGVFFDFGTYEANPEFTATYYVTGPTSSTEYTFDPADGSTIPSLSEITVGYADGICCSWNYTKEVTVTDKNGNVVANSYDCEDNWPDSWDDPCVSSTIILDTKVVAAGDYTVNIPAGYFVVGENDLNSEALTIHYTIDGSEAVEPGTFVCVVDPDGSEDLEELAQVAFYNPTVDEEIFVNDELARDPEIYVYNEAGDVVTTISYFDTIWDEYFTKEYAQIAVFEDAVTEEGTYTVSVPAEMFIIYDEDGRAYYSEAMTLTYTIKTDAGTETGIGGISINDENVEGIYSTNGQKLNSTVKGVNIIRYSDGSVKKLYVK